MDDQKKKEKKAPYMKEQMAQADLEKRSQYFERMNGQPQLLSSNKITHYFKKWTAEIDSGVLML